MRERRWLPSPRRALAGGFVAALIALATTAGAQTVPGQTAPTQPAPAASPASEQPKPAEPAPKAAPAPKPVISEGIQVIRQRLDELKADLDEREKTITGRSVRPASLTKAREGLDEIADRIRRVIDLLDPRLEGARERLEQLGPTPKEGAESDDVAKQRGERENAVAEIDQTQRLARSLLVQSNQILEQIADRRRTAFTQDLFQRSTALVGPTLWLDIADDLPGELGSLRNAVEEVVSQFFRNGTLWNLTFLGGALGISFALYFGRRNIAPALGRRSADVKDPTRRKKLLAAWRVILLGTLPAVAGSYAVFYALDVTDILPDRLLPVAAAILAGLAFIAFVQAMCDALLSVGKPDWRPTPVSDAAAWRVTALAVSIAVVITVSKSVEALNSGLYAALPISIATRGIGAIAAAALLAIGLHRFADTADKEEACFGPYVAPDAATGIGGPLRLLGWAAVVFVAGAALVGYVALSAFLVDQMIWVASVGVLLWLLTTSVDTLIGGALSEDTRLATMLQANTGLRKRSLQQIAVLTTGIARVLLFAVAALLVLAPWGLDSSDVFASVRTAFFGFKIGDVTISLSTISSGLTIFVIGILITRAVRRWLEHTYLPTTELDAGLRNSIATVAGYIGFLLALALACSYLGLSLEKLTIVAGALSVGIGFGLQSIVNNFVSGLLLLWERPIRVGDQVLIGDSEGIVKRISVRSTEIQTFDRSAVIVPNSNLISGIVKNRVRGDRTGRVILPVSVLRNQDPVRAAEMLVEAAKAHPDALKEPPPRVVFKKIGDPFLDFDLIVLVNDVNNTQRVQSELNFTVFRALSEAGLIPAMGPAASFVTVQGLEPMRDALGLIAGAVGQRDGGEASKYGDHQSQEPSRRSDPADNPEDRAPSRLSRV